MKDYQEAYGIATRNFFLNGLLAPGGLSAAWGAGACCFTENELKDFPIDRTELIPSYQAVASRIGISGLADDALNDWLGAELPLQPPLPLHDGARGLLDRYQGKREGARRHGLRLGRVRHAVLSQDLGERKSCAQTNLCLWGCSRDSIFDARQDLAALVSSNGLTLWCGSFVSSVRPAEGGGFVLQLRGRDGEAARTVRAPRVVLAAGTIGSTVLALGCRGIGRTSIRLLTSPVMAFGLFLPWRLGAVATKKGFGMAQLAFSLDIPLLAARQSLYGGIFATDGIPLSELISRMPVSRPTAVAVARRLWPAMLVGSCFFPGELTNNRMVFDADSQEGAVTITGAFTEQFDVAFAQARRGLAKAFGRLGAFVIPGSLSISPPGADMHYSGTLPMRSSPVSQDGKIETDRFGQLHGVPSLYVVDGSVLPSLPGKAHTLTIMANADRIGRHIAEEWHHFPRSYAGQGQPYARQDV
jgi:choline dehydrogenase-like flavoprotein